MTIPGLSSEGIVLRTVDKIDMRLLGRIAAEGASFMRHASHEHRAYDLARRGLLKRRSAVYRTGPSTVEYRWLYAITDEGRSVLQGQEPEA